MSIDAIICDWNGTLISYRDERHLLEGVALDVFRATLPFHPFRIVRILRARKQLEALHTEGRSDAGLDFVRAMFSVYNDRVINGTPVSVIHRSIGKYAASPQTQRALDLRVLRTIRHYHQAGTITGILSAGYGYGIERVLTAAGYYRYFDFCKANLIREHKGKVTEFCLALYQRKHEALLELLSERSLDAGRVAYIGDSEDDEGCFQMVGHPILAFLSPNGLKERYARDYNAFVPENEHDLLTYLKSE